MALVGGALERLVPVSGRLAPTVVLLLPALEASALVGVVVPGAAGMSRAPHRSFLLVRSYRKGALAALRSALRAARSRG